MPVTISQTSSLWQLTVTPLTVSCSVKPSALTTGVPSSDDMSTIITLIARPDGPGASGAHRESLGAAP